MRPPFPRTDLKIEVLYVEEEGGYSHNVTFGDGSLVDKVEPWMLEAVVVAEDGLRRTREKLESAVLSEFASRAHVLREARRQERELLNVTRQELEEATADLDKTKAN